MKTKPHIKLTSYGRWTCVGVLYCRDGAVIDIAGTGWTASEAWTHYVRRCRTERTIHGGELV